MFIRRSLLLALLLSVALVSPARAWTSRTAESTALSNIGSFIKFFESEKKRMPESWKELDEFWEKPLDRSYPLVLPTRRYELFSPPPNIRLYGRSVQVIAMTRKPMWETTREGNMGRTLALKGPGRYLLRRSEDGSIASEWLPEPAIQRFWPSTGRALPVPDDEPERPWVKAAREQMMMKRVGIGVASALVAAWIAARFLGKRRDRATQLVG
ncbi:MAG: hypothetical protein EOP83_24855 [Verrucomicrobiaceae bacterium]|nr:MAG: hypothetical protein EOP83_24855 [Verrucomicrobiaceae bacterium]